MLITVTKEDVQELNHIASFCQVAALLCATAFTFFNTVYIIGDSAFTIGKLLFLMATGGMSSAFMGASLTLRYVIRAIHDRQDA